MKLLLFKFLQKSFFWLSYPLQNKGLYRVSRTLGNTFFDRSATHIAPIGKDTVFKFYLVDPYWNRLLIPKFIYEPELHHLFKKIKDVDFHFIDCGANLGYWSMLVAGKVYGSKPTTTIEPIQSNFDLIKDNVNYNKLSNVTLYKNAVSKKSGETVKLVFVENDFSNTAASVSENITKTSQYEEVSTITLYDLLIPLKKKQIVVKLDIEGQEIAALESADDLLKSNSMDILFSYEDHGNDPTCMVTKHFFNIGYHILFISDSGMTTSITSIEKAMKLKTNIHKGYNFIAFKANSSFKPYF